MRELVKVAQFLKVVLQEENQGDYDKEQMIFWEKKRYDFSIGKLPLPTKWKRGLFLGSLIEKGEFLLLVGSYKN